MIDVSENAKDSAQEPAAAEPQPPPLPNASSGNSRRRDLAELLVFVSLFLPRIVGSYMIGGHGSATFLYTALVTILSDLPPVALIGYFLWRNGESRRAIGLKAQGWWREALLGVGLYIPYAMVIGGVSWCLMTLCGKRPTIPTIPTFLQPTRDGLGYTLAVVLLIVVAFSEEVVFRGYLMLRLKSVTGHMAWAIGVSAMLFALAHGYQSWISICAIVAIGLIFSLIYLWRRSLVAPMVIHFIQDFMAMIIAPLLMHYYRL